MRGRPLEETTALKIKEAAREIFLAKGYDGATMQVIADHAGFNKAQLHYYFRSKDALFLIIFEEEINKVLGTIRPMVLDQDIPVLEKLDAWIEKQMSFFRKVPQLPLFIVTEMNRNPKVIQKLLEKVKIPEIAQGLFRTKDGPSVEAIQTALGSAMSLVVFPLLWEPLFRFVASIDDEHWNALLDRQVLIAKKVIRLAIQSP